MAIGASRDITDAITDQEALSELEMNRIEALARHKVAERREVLARRTPHARQMLAKLLRDRLVFVPEQRGDRFGYRFSGDGTIIKLLEATIPDLRGKLVRPQRDVPAVAARISAGS